MSDYRVDIKVRNNVFLYRLEKAGYKTASEFCRVNNKLNYLSRILSVINMTESPFQSDGEWKKAIIWAADMLSCAPEDLFNDVQLHTVLKTNKKQIEVSEAEMRFMIDQSNNVVSLEDFKQKEIIEKTVSDTLNTLPPRLKKIMEMRMGLGEHAETMTLEEIGNKEGISRNRVRELEQQALRMLRHPTRADKLKQFLESNKND